MASAKNKPDVIAAPEPPGEKWLDVHVGPFVYEVFLCDG
jgi:hypothetical protein